MSTPNDTSEAVGPETRACFMCRLDVAVQPNGFPERHQRPGQLGSCSGELMPAVDGVCDQRCGHLWPGCGHSLTKESAT